LAHGKGVLRRLSIAGLCGLNVAFAILALPCLGLDV